MAFHVQFDKHGGPGMYNLIFTSLGYRIQKHEIDPLTGESVLVDIKSNTYDKLPETRLNLSIKSIEPHIENGILKSLEFEPIHLQRHCRL